MDNQTTWGGGEKTPAGQPNQTSNSKGRQPGALRGQTPTRDQGISQPVVPMGMGWRALGPKRKKNAESGEMEKKRGGGVSSGNLGKTNVFHGADCREKETNNGVSQGGG